MTEATIDLADLQREVSADKEALEDLRTEFAEKECQALADLERSQARLAHAAAGVDPETRDRALRLICIHGKVERLTDKLINEAVEDLAAGGHELRQHAFALKDYEGFTGQELLCAYIGDYIGSPKHGHVVAAIGLTREAREFWDKWGKLPSGEGEEAVHAAIRYLLNVREAGVV